MWEYPIATPAIQAHKLQSETIHGSKTNKITATAILLFHLDSRPFESGI